MGAKAEVSRGHLVEEESTIRGGEEGGVPVDDFEYFLKRFARLGLLLVEVHAVVLARPCQEGEISGNLL